LVTQELIIMKAKKRNAPQRPVYMSQEEMEGLKVGNADAVTLLHKRIALASPVTKTKAGSKKQKPAPSPVKLSAAQLREIKKTGKIPKAIEVLMAKERKKDKAAGALQHKYGKAKEPDMRPPGK
jgi:hypothetical protein